MAATQPFQVYVNNKPVVTAERVLTGGEVKELAGVPADYALYLVRGNETVPVPDAESIDLHEHEHFRAIPTATFGRS